MSVNNLRTPEDGVTLDTRDPKWKNAKKVEPDVAQELVAIRQRIGVAASIKPEGGFRDSNHAEAWLAGRDAVLRVLNGQDAIAVVTGISMTGSVK